MELNHPQFSKLFPSYCKSSKVCTRTTTAGTEEELQSSSKRSNVKRPPIWPPQHPINEERYCLPFFSTSLQFN